METAFSGSSGGRQKLAAAAIPIFVAPTGTMANNGGITLGTALALAYPSCYVLLPAGAIAAGVPAASTWYFCQMSSTTVGTVFNNIYTTGVPTIPASPTAFVTTGPGAYTGLTGVQAGLQITVPGGSMGPNGAVVCTAYYSNNNSAGTKTETWTWGGATLLLGGQTTNQTVTHYREIWNCGVTNVQKAVPAALPFGGANANPPISFSSDTTAAQILAFKFNNNTATDWAAIEHFLVELIAG